MVVGVLWRFAPGTGYATSMGAFVVGRLGFAGSLGIDVLVVNFKMDGGPTWGEGLKKG